jgi:hypothetical protein
MRILVASKAGSSLFEPATYRFEQSCSGFDHLNATSLAASLERVTRIDPNHSLESLEKRDAGRSVEPRQVEDIDWI